MTEQKNTLLAIVLSAVVLIGWQYFYGLPQMQRQAQNQAQNQPQTQQTQPNAPNANVTVPGQSASAAALSRDQSLKESARITVDTPSLKGSIALKGARIDDVSLVNYRETVDPQSPPIDLLSPARSPHPFYAEFGWLAAAPASGTAAAVPNADTVWQQQGSGGLTPSHPVVLTYDNGAGLKFRRTISVDDKYLFTVKDEVVNGGAQPVTLYPYGLISRHGTPPTLGYYIMHEGLIGEIGDKGEKEVTYKKIDEEKKQEFNDVTNAWLGITDEYWAAALLPDPKLKLNVTFSSRDEGSIKTYQTDYRLPAQVIAPGATASVSGQLFAGAKEVHTVNDYNKRLDLNHFDLLIDWGLFWFFTKPLFEFMDLINHWVGNFGVAILIVTVVIKARVLPACQQVLRVDGQAAEFAILVVAPDTKICGGSERVGIGDNHVIQIVKSPQTVAAELQIRVAGGGLGRKCI